MNKSSRCYKIAHKREARAKGSETAQARGEGAGRDVGQAGLSVDLWEKPRDVLSSSFSPQFPNEVEPTHRKAVCGCRERSASDAREHGQRLAHRLRLRADGHSIHQRGAHESTPGSEES